jgi:hypothetical protein
METKIGNRGLEHVAGALGIAGQIAGAYFFLLYPALTVPSPENYLFFFTWAVLLGFAIAWWRRHPWRSFLIPVISVPAVMLVLETGKRFLGWAP